MPKLNVTWPLVLAAGLFVWFFTRGVASSIPTPEQAANAMLTVLIFIGGIFIACAMVYWTSWVLGFGCNLKEFLTTRAGSPWSPYRRCLCSYDDNKDWCRHESAQKTFAHEGEEYLIRTVTHQ